MFRIIFYFTLEKSDIKSQRRRLKIKAETQVIKKAYTLSLIRTTVCFSFELWLTLMASQ